MMKAKYTSIEETVITTREARYQLFQIDSKEADTLRRELFDINEQDEPLPAEFVSRFNKAIA
jgi:hypothetical protein